MEAFTEVNLEKYEPMLTKIEIEQTELEQLQKQCEQLKNKLLVFKILNNPTFARDKLFQVRVKIFNNTYEVSDTFPESIPIDELQETSIAHENCLYYYIEVFISQLFHEKLITQNWIINVSIVSRTMRIGKSLNVKNRVSNPLCFLIPFDEDVHNIKVEAYLLFPESDEFWPNLKLASIPLDVSYRFANLNASTRKQSFKNEIVRINRMYNPEACKEYSPVLLKYGFVSRWNKELFVELILKHSYHRLDPNIVFSEEKDAVVARFSIDGISTVVELNYLNGVVKVEACARDLFLLKKYFVLNRGRCLKGDFKQAHGSKKLKDMVSRLQTGDVNLSNVYYKYVEFMSFYPL